MFYQVATGQRLFQNIDEIEIFIKSEKPPLLMSLANPELREFLKNNFLQRSADERSLTRAITDPFLEYEFLPSFESKMLAQNAENLAESYQLSEKFEKALESFCTAQKYFSSASFWEQDPAESIKLNEKSIKNARNACLLDPNDFFGTDLSLPQNINNSDVSEYTHRIIKAKILAKNGSDFCPTLQEAIEILIRLAKNSTDISEKKQMKYVISNLLSQCENFQRPKGVQNCQNLQVSNSSSENSSNCSVM